MKLTKATKFLLAFIAIFLVVLYWEKAEEKFLSLRTDFAAIADESNDLKTVPDLEPVMPETMKTERQGLTGKVCAVLLFVDDETTCWTEEEATAFSEKYIQPGIAFLQEQAALYSIDLELSTLLYTSNENRPVYYNGILGGGFTAREEDGRRLIYPDDTKQNFDVLEHIAVNWGFDSVTAMYQALLEKSGAEQIRFVVIPNKGGWSCARTSWNDVQNSFCYIYAKDHLDQEPAETTFPHEFLHLFGAEDLYVSTEMDGTVLRENRNEMAKKLHNNAIMLGGGLELTEKTVCGYTAYLIGWLDALPPEYNSEEWFS